MSTLNAAIETPPFPRSGPDDVAITALDSGFAKARHAFATDRFPALSERKRRIETLIHMMLGNRTRISAALHADFGAHPSAASDLIEVLGVVGRAQHVLKQIESWMQISARETDQAVLGSAAAYIQYQPKGVIGNMVPWNFPFDLSIGPLIEMLAAGNRVILKPSEYTPVCSELLHEMVSQAFDPDLVQVAVGGIDLARHFAALPWDHLLYTGNADVGRLVMAAAARNLTPVTLELGGKCPALMTPHSVNERSVESVIGTKLIKNGQMCISVDYCLVPRAEMPRFISLAQAFMRNTVPNYARGPDCTGIISTRHLERLLDLLNEAKSRGSRVITLDSDEVDLESRRMPLSLVVDPAPELRMMREEIFGPILPLVPYDDLDAAVQLINSGERPLGLYLFGDDMELIERVLGATSSGGAAVNACAVQGAVPSLAFGGVGLSGMGRHHGIEGFREFSNPRGVVVRGSGDIISAFYAPHSKAAAVVQAALGTSSH